MLLVLKWWCQLPILGQQNIRQKTPQIGMIERKGMNDKTNPDASSSKRDKDYKLKVDIREMLEEKCEVTCMLMRRRLGSGQLHTLQNMDLFVH